MTQEFVEVEVAEVIRETADSCSLVLDVPESLAGRFAYQAGQFLTFEIPWQDFTIRRCYSLSSAPGIDSAPKVTVKRVTDGRMSNWINDTLQPGARVRVSPPDGRFVLNEDAGDSDLTLFGAGSGITPLISLLKAALAGTRRNVELVYANRDAQSIIFADELAELERQHGDRLRVRHHLDGESGFLTVEDVRGAMAGREKGEFYVCGPSGFMDVVEEALEAAEIPVQHAHFERFVSPADADRAEQDASRPLGTEAPESFVVKLSGRKHTIPYQGGETLLEAAKRAGVNAPSSCEDGFCGSCMAQLVQGDVQMRTHKALTDHEVEAGRVLLCQSLPASGELLLVDYDAASFTIAGSRERRQTPRLIGAGVFLFLCAAIWILRSAG